MLSESNVTAKHKNPSEKGNRDFKTGTPAWIENKGPHSELSIQPLPLTYH